MNTGALPVTRGGGVGGVGLTGLIRKDTTDGAKANNPGGEVVETRANRTRAPSTK